MIIISVCLSDIDKQFVRKGKNGKTYINLLISKRKALSPYGESHSVAISKTKEERELDDKVIYVGGGKGYFDDAFDDQALDKLTDNEADNSTETSNTTNEDNSTEASNTTNEDNSTEASNTTNESEDDDLPF